MTCQSAVASGSHLGLPPGLPNGHQVSTVQPARERKKMKLLIIDLNSAYFFKKVNSFSFLLHISIVTEAEKETLKLF